jgi:hypothetical protein
MGTSEHTVAGDPRSEATTLELWGAGELRDETGAGNVPLAVGAMTALLVVLAAFFVAFAPGV